MIQQNKKKTKDSNMLSNSGSVAKNPKIEAKFQFHIKEYKKAGNNLAYI